MKLLEALEIVREPAAESSSKLEIFLLCGFTPLHLQTFLAAHIRLQFPARTNKIKTGLFGNLAGNIERLEQGSADAACVLIEWPDLDPRLGIRSLGGWQSEDIPDIVQSVQQQCLRLVHLIGQAAKVMPLFVSTPTLPLPPIFVTRTNQAQKDECRLRELAASVAASVSAIKNVKVISPQWLDETSPFARRFNPKEALSTGFPYSLEHACILAESLAVLIKDAQPRKGIITDLDDTMWAGILGEDGVEGISWDTASGAHLHGLYQRFLASLASSGVLLAVASKNDRSMVENALARTDILLSRDKLYPLEVHWGAKSESVRRILKQWNIEENDVIFIDDSPMELGEVQSVFPQMECISFPKGDGAALWKLFKHLRDSFGKDELLAEDSIRLRSIRDAEAFREFEGSSASSEDGFLRSAGATITFSSKVNAHDSRAFELINKTNQFNLNGRRLTQSEWSDHLQRPGAFVLTAAYEDKYGALGKIAVVTGTANSSTCRVEFWVMSCRAFSRRIEYACLKYLFEKMCVGELVFDYRPTPRNGPLQDFFRGLLGTEPAADLSLFKESYSAKSPVTYQRFVEAEYN